MLASAAALTLGAAGHGSVFAGTRFQPETAAAFGTRDIWLLGSGELWRSTDAGQQFGRVAAPPLPSQGIVPTVAFGNARDGFAYVQGTTPLYVTHDGGESWHRALSRSTIEVALGGGTVYALTGRCSPRSGCRAFRLRRSRVAGEAWQTLVLPFRGSLPFTLAAGGGRLWLLGGSSGRAHDLLATSSDRGGTFAVRPGPRFPDLGGRLAPAGNGVLWAVCSTGQFSVTYHSSDGGRSFTVSRTYDQTNGAQIAAASPRVAVVFPGAGMRPPVLVRTTDGGSTWRGIREPRRASSVLSLGFSTSRVGAALVQTTPSSTQLWRTTAGGASWRIVPLPRL